MSASPHSGSTSIAALKGLAIASSLLTAGHLGTFSLNIPSLYLAADTAHRVAAQQFAQQYRVGKAAGAPAEILTGLVCGGLAYLQYSDRGARGAGWKLWAGAAAAMLAVIPWTVALMEAPARKLLWVAEVAETATRTPGPSSTGIGVKVSDERGADVLGLPGGTKKGFGRGAGRDGSITPIEEFEPFDDGVVTEHEYEQLKVRKLLKTFNSYNTVRAIGPLVSGMLGLWAVLTE